MDIMGKVDDRKIVVMFEQPHLPEIQKQIFQKGKEINKDFKVMIENPNVFNNTCVNHRAKKVYIPETLGAGMKEKIKNAYSDAGIPTEILKFKADEAEEAEAPKTRRKTQNETD